MLKSTKMTGDADKKYTFNSDFFEIATFAKALPTTKQAVVL